MEPDNNHEKNNNSSQQDKNSNIENFIEKLGKLDRLKGGIRQGFLKGDAKNVFEELASKNNAPIRIDSTGKQFFQSGGTRVTLYPSSTTKVPTLQINNGSQIYKIRIIP